MTKFELNKLCMDDNDLISMLKCNANMKSYCKLIPLG